MALPCTHCVHDQHAADTSAELHCQVAQPFEQRLRLHGTDAKNWFKTIMSQSAVTPNLCCKCHLVVGVVRPNQVRSICIEIPNSAACGVCDCAELIELDILTLDLWLVLQPAGNVVAVFQYMLSSMRFRVLLTVTKRQMQCVKALGNVLISVDTIRHRKAVFWNVAAKNKCTLPFTFNFTSQIQDKAHARSTWRWWFPFKT